MRNGDSILRYIDLFPQDLDAYFTAGGDAAVLPIGSVEQHGPHLPLGCDGYNAELIAEFTAMHAGAVLFPMVPLSWIGGLRAWPGTLNMRPWNTGDFLEAVLVDIVGMGFRRILVVNCHGGGYEMTFTTAQAVFHKTGVHVLSMYPSRVYWAFPELAGAWGKAGEEQLDWNIIENATCMGALEHRGRPDLLEKVKRNMDEALRQYGEAGPAGGPASFRRAQALGTVGHDYLEENRHVQPRAAADADIGLRAAELVGRKLAQALSDLKDWVEKYENGMGK